MNLDKAPQWYRSLPIQLIHDKAEEYGLDPFLIAAICRQESNCNPWAIRYEPNNVSFVFGAEFAKKNGITLETETLLQSSSLGLMQVMGYVARSLGFKIMLTAVCDPINGIDLGAKLLKDLFKRFKDQDAVISAYNQGSPHKTSSGSFKNQTYVDSVKAHLKELTQSF